MKNIALCVLAGAVAGCAAYVTMLFIEDRRNSDFEDDCFEDECDDDDCDEEDWYQDFCKTESHNGKA